MQTSMPMWQCQDTAGVSRHTHTAAWHSRDMIGKLKRLVYILRHCWEMTSENRCHVAVLKQKSQQVCLCCHVSALRRDTCAHTGMSVLPSPGAWLARTNTSTPPCGGTEIWQAQRNVPVVLCGTAGTRQPCRLYVQGFLSQFWDTAEVGTQACSCQQVASPGNGRHVGRHVWAIR